VPVHTAQYAGYLEWKAKGAPVAFVIPEAGLRATPETWGLPTNGPHPNAGRLASLRHGDDPRFPKKKNGYSRYVSPEMPAIN
jgi:hypothetical protein